MVSNCFSKIVKRKFILFTLASFQTIFIGTFSMHALASEEASVVIALKPNKNPDKMSEERKKLEKHLTSIIGKKVEVVIPLSSSTILQGFANKTIDLGYLSSVDMVNARRKGVAEILLAGEIKGKTSYESIWLVQKASSIKSFKQLKNQPISFASRTSTSGYLIPFWDLIQAGVIQKNEKPENFFGAGNVVFGTGYVSAVKKLLNGDVRAAAVSDYVYFGNKHLTEKQKKQLRVLKKQGPVPTHSIAVRNSMGEEEKKSLKRALISFGKKQPTLSQQIFTSKLVEVSPAKHLATTIDALDRTGLVLKK